MAKVKRSRGAGKSVSAVQELAALGLKLGVIVLLLVGGYIIYGFQSGAVGDLASLPAVDRQRVLQNMALACRVLGVTSIIVTACAIIRYYTEEVLGYMLSLAGALLYFGPPLVLAGYEYGSAATREVTGGVASSLRSAGLVMFVPGSVMVVIDLVRRIIRSLTRPRITTGTLVWGREAPTRLSVKAKLYGSCWELPHCREFVRKLCPAYQERTSCWRLKSGCYCDERTVLRAMQARGAATQLVKNAQFSHGLAGHRAVSAAQKRARCRNCAIYAEHQRQKYRIISPLVFPAVAISIWFLTPTIQLWIQSAIQFTDRFMKVVSFSPQGAAGSSRWAEQLTGSGAVEWMFIAWLGIMAVSYMLQLVEYFIFKVQI